MPRGILIWRREVGTYGVMNGRSHLAAGRVPPLLLVVITSALSNENPIPLASKDRYWCDAHGGWNGASPLGKKGRNLLASSTQAQQVSNLTSERGGAGP